MSLGKRLLDLARANLTDFRHALQRDEDRELLDAERDARAREEPVEASEPGDDPDGETLGARAGRGARRFKDAAEEAWERAFEAARARAGVRGDPPTDPAAERRRWYRTLLQGGRRFDLRGRTRHVRESGCGRQSDRRLLAR